MDAKSVELEIAMSVENMFLGNERESSSLNELIKHNKEKNTLYE